MPADQTTLNHTARVLVTVTPQLPADAALRRYFYHHDRLAPQLRRAISRCVFNYYRWLRWVDTKQSLQKQLDHALHLNECFVRDAKSVKPEALAARAVPEWLTAEIDWPEAKVGAVVPNGPSAAKDNRPYPSEAAYLRQLQREPALWLRARPGKAHHLAQTLGHGQTSQHAPDAVRYSGEKDLFRTAQFHEGAFEIQDLASQLVALAAAPFPGQTWWDACAGEGGKTLHLADLMQNKGLIWATDRNERRLQTLKRRAARAKIFNFRTATWDGSERLPTKAKFDGILIDAPCSGVGTWQRNPHARWTTTLDDVRELAATQTALLHHAAGSLKSGGRLLYAVCTLTRSETTAIADAFTAAHPEFTPAPLQALGSSLPALTLWPHELNANGMFIAAWQKA
ncbi:MAG: RsmB/NOP family class I SAM-dependent RNA methyltransferase [Opitutaceae bacterium]|nr:RsmB/NOP family class I SAM-dependent RNA methyltransferase [Opitutaceae bacterium]